MTNKQVIDIGKKVNTAPLCRLAGLAGHWWRRFWDRLTMAGFDIHTVRGQSPPERVR